MNYETLNLSLHTKNPFATMSSRVTSGPHGLIIEQQSIVAFYFLITNFRQNVKVKWKKNENEIILGNFVKNQNKRVELIKFP
jgi:hypothetical protein